MNRWMLPVTVGCFLALAGATHAQEKASEQILKDLAELRAEIKGLKAKIAKLEGDAGKPMVSEHDRKWVRELIHDWMRELLTAKGTNVSTRFKAALKFVPWDGEVYKTMPDPNVKVKAYYRWDGVVLVDRMGPRDVFLDYVFDSFHIDTEDVSPDKQEILLKGKLRGAKAALSYEENRKGIAGTLDQRTTEILEGELGERTGTFRLRLSRDEKSNCWAVTYFVWSVDELQANDEKK